METQTVRHKKSPSTRGWWALCLMKIAMGVVGLRVDVMRRWCQAVIFAFPLLTALREGKVLRLAEGVTHSRIMGRNGLVEIIRLSITPSANRNSCRVARLVGVDTQGSVLRPQPWAGESQLCQSCCCLRSLHYIVPQIQNGILNFGRRIINYILNFAHFLPKKWMFGLIVVLFG